MMQRLVGVLVGVVLGFGMVGVAPVSAVGSAAAVSGVTASAGAVSGVKVKCPKGRKGKACRKAARAARKAATRTVTPVVSGVAAQCVTVWNPSIVDGINERVACPGTRVTVSDPTAFVVAWTEHVTGTNYQWDSRTLLDGAGTFTVPTATRIVINTTTHTTELTVA